MALFPAEIIARKAKCFSSSWWCIEREPDQLDDDGELLHHGRPIRFILLDRAELHQLAYTGQVSIRGHESAVTV